MQTLTDFRRNLIKPSFTTRRVDLDRLHAIDDRAQDLAPGDLVLARVEEIGQHTRIERPDGRKAILYPGDELLLACGARYAPDQFEADCPEQVGPANLVAAGGIAGLVRESHSRMKPATEITLLGAALDAEGKRLRLVDHRVPDVATATSAVPIVAVCGTSMNSGKTHTVASLARGLTLAGLKVAAIKATGTGSGGDLWFFRDSGAVHIADFTDAGFATTYRADPHEILGGIRCLIADAVGRDVDVVLMEIADGLGQGETAALLRMPELRSLLSGVIFSASDALGAVAGVAWLQREGHAVSAVSGLLTASPLALRETLAQIDLPCLTPMDLMTPDAVMPLVESRVTLARPLPAAVSAM